MEEADEAQCHALLFWFRMTGANFRMGRRGSAVATEPTASASARESSSALRPTPGRLHEGPRPGSNTRHRTRRLHVELSGVAEQFQP